MQSIEEGKLYGAHEKEKMQIGVTVLPDFNKDTTDRNRTSPFAFTGNKFEFRMLGSSESIACANIMINAAVAEELKQFADILEGSKDFTNDLHNLILKTIKEHKRIIFNGNGYDDSWVQEAEKRGLLNLKSTPEAYSHLLDAKNKKVLSEHGILSEVELASRYEIYNENYSKVINIEALTMLDMAKKLYLPAASKYAKELAEIVSLKKAAGGADDSYESELLAKVSSLTAAIYNKVKALDKAVIEAKNVSETGALALYYRNTVFQAMSELRENVDELEGCVPAEVWPVPSYADLLFSVK